MGMLFTEKCRLWIEQFAPSDRLAAEQLLSQFKFVDADTFRYDLSYLIDAKLPPGEPAALYVEREEPKTTQRMYKEVTTYRGRCIPPKRSASGIALPTMRPVRKINQIVGSEGIVANIVTNLSRLEPDRFVVQPSAELLRQKRVRHLVVVTDFVGSGTRVARFLSLLWNVRSIRSWRSYHKVKIWVLAYTGTQEGCRLIRAHRALPAVELVAECPTIRDAFNDAVRPVIVDLCQRYSPAKKEPFGYKDVGALVAFSHGCSNDVPAVFHKGSTSIQRPWQALFPKRVAQDVVVDESRPDPMELALDALGFSTIKRSLAYLRSCREQQRVVVLLCAIRRGRHHLKSMAFVTGLHLDDLVQAEMHATAQGLLTADRRVTEAGFALVKKLNTPIKTTSSTQRRRLSTTRQQRYYPTSLRAPR